VSQWHTNQVAKIKDETEVFNLVAEGYTFTAISERLKLNRRTVASRFRRALEHNKIPEGRIQEWRILVNVRLDKALNALWPKVEKGDLEAIRTMLKIEERRARMLGIDKPQKLDVTHYLPANDPEAAADRQKRRLNDSGFPTLSTAPPQISAPRVIDVETNGSPD
jgi:hypothetical protein